MKRLYLLFALAVCLPAALFAQQTESKKKSAWHLTIPEVTVIGHLHADVFHRPMTDDRDFGDGQMPGRFLLAFRLLRKECGGETNSQSE